MKTIVQACDELFGGPLHSEYRLAMAEADTVPRSRNDREWDFVANRLVEGDGNDDGEDESDEEDDDVDDSEYGNENIAREAMITWMYRMMGRRRLVGQCCTYRSYCLQEY